MRRYDLKVSAIAQARQSRTPKVPPTAPLDTPHVADVIVWGACAKAAIQRLLLGSVADIRRGGVCCDVSDSGSQRKH